MIGKVRYLKFEIYTVHAACKTYYAKKSQVICSSSALVSYAFFAIRRCKVNVHDITAIVYTVRQIAAGRNYNRVEVFRTSRVASMLPCSSCVYTYI